MGVARAIALTAFFVGCAARPAAPLEAAAPTGIVVARPSPTPAIDQEEPTTLALVRRLHPDARKVLVVAEGARRTTIEAELVRAGVAVTRVDLGDERYCYRHACEQHAAVIVEAAAPLAEGSPWLAHARRLASANASFIEHWVASSAEPVESHHEGLELAERRAGSDLFDRWRVIAPKSAALAGEGLRAWPLVSRALSFPEEGTTSAVGYLVRLASGEPAIELPHRVGPHARVLLRGAIADGLAARLPEADAVDALGACRMHGLCPHAMSVSSRIVGVRGPATFVSASSDATVLALEVSEVVVDVDASVWPAVERRHAPVLQRALGAIRAGDLGRAADALDEAATILDAPLGPFVDVAYQPRFERDMARRLRAAVADGGDGKAILLRAGRLHDDVSRADRFARALTLPVLERALVVLEREARTKPEAEAEESAVLWWYGISLRGGPPPAFALEVHQRFRKRLVEGEAYRPPPLDPPPVR